MTNIFEADIGALSEGGSTGDVIGEERTEPVFTVAWEALTGGNSGPVQVLEIGRGVDVILARADKVVPGRWSGLIEPVT
jgi:hypothetical protein